MRSVAMKGREKDYTEKPFFKKIILFTIPLMLSNVLQLLYSAADTIILARFGAQNSAGAVSMTGSITSLLTNVFMGLSTGSCVLFAKYMGEKNAEKAQKVVHTAVATGLTFGVCIAVFGFFTSGFLLNLMSVTDDYFGFANIYLKIVFWGMPALFLYNFSASILLGSGDSKRPFIFSSISGLSNVLLNLLFVLVLRMDTVGVALATVISQYLMAILAIISLLKKEDMRKLVLKKIKFHKEEFIGMIKIGLPNGIQSALFSFADMTVQTGINKSVAEGVGGFTNSVINGNTYAGNVSGFIYVAMRSVYTACVTFVGQNNGAKKYDNVKKVLSNCVIIVTIYAVTLAWLAILLAKPFLSLYTSNAEEIKQGAYRMSIVLPFHFILGIMDIFIGLFHGLGKSTVPMVASVVFCCAFRVVYIYTIFAAHTTLLCLYVMYPITHGVTLLVLLAYYFFIERKKLNKQEQEIESKHQELESECA